MTNAKTDAEVIAILRKALVYYADPLHHEVSRYDRENDCYESAVEIDGGYIAKQALKEVGGHSG